MSLLSETKIQARNEAPDDEYWAWTTYNQVMADFSEIPRFSNIGKIEALHIETLYVLFERYGRNLP